MSAIRPPVPDLSRTARRALPAAVAAALWLAGCTATAPEVHLPPQTLTDAPSDEMAATMPERTTPPPPRLDEGELPPAEAPPPVDDAAATDRPRTIVIQGSESAEATPQSLFAASQAERQRRGRDGDAAVRITNENLAEHAEGGQLSVATAAATATDPDGEPEADARRRGEDYWRSGALEHRVAWKEAVERVE
ncbi:MAG: hypothetical protein R3190_13000, partial [Thermoanaerobaculia bacterium]|nr:hypothetical protein [Thermoanaerobaculia bacterium]